MTVQFTREDTKTIKGIAIGLMLYHHLFYYPERIAESISYTPLFNYHGMSAAYLLGQFGKLCVALFLFLGGYGTFLSFQKHAEADKADSSILFHKIKKLYLEYWKVFVIFIPICLLAGVERVVPDIGELIWNFTGLSITYCGEWWFFTTYIALLFTYPIGRRLLSRQKTIFHDFCAVLLLSLFVDFILPTFTSYAWAAKLDDSMLWTIVKKMLDYAPAFYMGCIFAKYDLLSKAKKQFTPGIKNTILACVVLLAAMYIRRKEGDVYDFLLAPLVTVFCITVLEYRLFKLVKRILEKIGQHSTMIWLVHSMYCYLLCQKLVYFPRYTFLIFLWLLLLSFVTSVILQKLYSLPAVIKDKIRKAKTDRELVL